VVDAARPSARVLPAPSVPSLVKTIFGLGNPGREYALTRHNVGWWVLDHLADTWSFDDWKRDGDALVTSGIAVGRRVRLVKPQTYMNLSGAALRPYQRRAAWSATTDLLVITDDVALPVGSFRIRRAGSSGGHNGLKSIEAALDSREYARIRIGILPADERRQPGSLADFVLAPLGKDERQTILGLMPTLTGAVETWLGQGIDAAMNAHNRRSTQC
jgi:peptidyl-tRNA hydrolase, PTH1 family